MKHLLLCSAILLASTACLTSDDECPGGPCDPDPSIDPSERALAFVVAGDFSSGRGITSAITLPDLQLARNLVDGVASDDPIVRHHDGTLYIINRFGHDNVTILDPVGPTVIDQISTGPGSNPQDVAVKGDTLYVAALSAPGVLLVDAAASAVVGTIDLSDLDPDGSPDCGSVYLVGDMLYVTCGLLDEQFLPRGPGKVAVIDTADNTVLSTFELGYPNPFGLLQPTPADGALAGDLLIATVQFDDFDAGCVERIATAGTPGSNGCLVENSDLGGYASGYAHGPDDTVVLAVTTGFDAMGTVAEARAYDAASATLDPEPITGPDQRTFEVAHCPTGPWIFADAVGGIRVYRADMTEATERPIDVGLPPIDNGVVCF